jgi:hypothetical protein
VFWFSSVCFVLYLLSSLLLSIHRLVHLLCCYMATFVLTLSVSLLKPEKIDSVGMASLHRFFKLSVSCLVLSLILNLLAHLFGHSCGSVPFLFSFDGLGSVPLRSAPLSFVKLSSRHRLYLVCSSSASASAPIRAVWKLVYVYVCCTMKYAIYRRFFDILGA